MHEEEVPVLFRSCDVGDVFMNIMLYHSVGSTESTGFQRPCTTEARISHSTVVPFPNLARRWALKGCYYEAAGVPLCEEFLCVDKIRYCSTCTPSPYESGPIYKNDVNNGLKTGVFYTRNHYFSMMVHTGEF